MTVDEDSSAKRGSKLANSRESIEDIVRFIEGHVSSLEELEVLLLLRAAAPRAFRVEEVCREVGSSLSSIEARLERLMGMQIVALSNIGGEKLYRYDPIDEQIAALIDGVTRLYKERRLFVIDLLYGRPESDIRAFSDAFRIKKGRGGA